jgi:hypothetical protein
MHLTLRLRLESDSRWIGDVSELPGVSLYGATSEDATRKVRMLARRVIAEEIEYREMKPPADLLQFSLAA